MKGRPWTIANRLVRRALAGAFAVSGAVAPLAAQEPPPPDSLARDSVTLVAPRLRADTLTRLQRRAPVAKPPLSPRRAFLLSAIVPGYAQSRLERGTSGAFFATIEMGAWAMLRRSATDLREVRGASGDTVPGNFVVNVSTGARTATNPVLPRFEPGIDRSRRLHVEDWTAAIVFNHLISGADAFVSAQLWDVPTRLTMVPTAQGLVLVATVRW